MSQRIGVDIDGVLADHIATRITFLSDRYEMTDVSTKIGRRGRWLAPKRGVVIAKVLQKLYDYRLAKYFQVTPIDGAKESLIRLRENGCEIILITHRRESARKYTLDWLRKHSIPFDDIIFNAPQDKTSIGNIDVLVDDRVENISSIASEDSEGILFLRRYNASDATTSMAVGTEFERLVTDATYQWNQIVTYILSIEQVACNRNSGD